MRFKPFHLRIPKKSILAACPISINDIRNHHKSDAIYDDWLKKLYLSTDNLAARKFLKRFVRDTQKDNIDNRFFL